MDSCKACGKSLIWALTPSGAKAPIERDIAENGNVMLLRPTQLAGELLAVTFSGEMLQRFQGGLRLNHFAYCPARQQFTKERAVAKDPHTVQA